ncbi:MAG: hypothetical protein KF859_09680 [Phycisphaeraceae bacterium]|nr:hypothetical protein [Phycisphaeraceae bacterium]
MTHTKAWLLVAALLVVVVVACACAWVLLDYTPKPESLIGKKWSEVVTNLGDWREAVSIEANASGRMRGWSAIIQGNRRFALGDKYVLVKIVDDIIIDAKKIDP